MKFNRNQITGFTLSLVFHGAILASLLHGQMSMQYSPAVSEALPLSLSMFQASEQIVAIEPAAVKPAVIKPPVVKTTTAKPVVTETIKSKSIKLKPKTIIKKPLPTIAKKNSEPKTVVLPQEKVAEEKTDQQEKENIETIADNATEDDTESKHPTQPSPSANIENATAKVAMDHGIIESLEARYMAALRSAIEANKFYPRRARRLKREGKVVVDFTISRNGQIHDVNIAMTSGTKLLDKAALDAVNKLGQFKPIPEQIQYEKWKLEIPMEFTLL